MLKRLVDMSKGLFSPAPIPTPPPAVAIPTKPLVKRPRSRGVFQLIVDLRGIHIVTDSGGLETLTLPAANIEPWATRPTAPPKPSLSLDFPPLEVPSDEETDESYRGWIPAFFSRRLF